MATKSKLWNEEHEIIKLYKSGLSSIDISNKFEVSKPLILAILKKNNIDTKRPIAFYKSGKTFEEIYGLEKAEEIKEKMSQARRGSKFTEDHKRKISEARLGFKHLEQSKNKMSETKKRLFKEGKIIPSWKGKKMSEETKRKLSVRMKGKTLEEVYGKEKASEMIKKFSTTLKQLHAEGKVKPNLFWLGKKHTKETKIKISLGNLGKRYTPEQRERMRLSHIGKQALEKNPMWQGGKSFEPYTPDFNKKFKEAIRIRDAFLCLKCGMREEDSLILLKQRLTCHHIDYIKENTFEENCCALCSRCNLEVNTNRESWTKFFQSLLSERYGYKYSEDGNVIIELNQEKVN